MKPLSMMIFFTVLTLFAGVARGADTEITIRILEDADAYPDNVVRELSLPPPTQPRGVTSSEKGRDSAREAREQRRDFGEESSRERRDSPRVPEDIPGTRHGR